jgi:PAS domain-containing protein
MPHSHERSVAATAQLEGWRLPVDAALQPVLVLDGGGRVCAASPAAVGLLALAAPGQPLADALGLRDLAQEWAGTPFARVLATGEPQRARVDLATQRLTVDVVASPLFGPTGVIGAMVFLTSC